MRKQSIVIAVVVACSLLPTAVVRAGHHGFRAGNIYGIYGAPSFMYPNAVGGYDTTYHGPRQFFVLPAKSHGLLGHFAAGSSHHHAHHGARYGGSGYCGSAADAYGIGCGSDQLNYDGPAAGSTSHEGPASGKAATSHPDEARGDSPTSFQLVSNVTRDGAIAFQKGLTMFRSRQLTEALGSFETAVAAEPSNAVYQYYVALTLYDLHGADAAGDSLQQAIELEQREPIANWGKRMERVQGRARAWIETARRNAGMAG